VAIGYPDLVSIANTTMNQTGQAIEGIAIIMAVYLTISLSISAFMSVTVFHMVERIQNPGYLRFLYTGRLSFIPVFTRRIRHFLHRYCWRRSWILRLWLAPPPCGV